jgi:hypothetical protein
VFAIAGLLNNKPWQSLFSQRPSFVPFAAVVLLIFGLVFGSVGTVYAAQDSLPNDLLYSIKLTGENLRLAFTSDTQARISLLTTFADRRLQEATILDSQGQPIPDELPVLMETYIAELLTLTTSQDETAVQDDPVAIHKRPQDRDQARTNPMTGNEDKLPLDQLREMRNECRRLASIGDGDVEFNHFLNKFQQQFKHAQAGPPESPNTYKQVFKHQQGIPAPITSTVTSTITTTLTVTPEVTVTLTITPGQQGPGYGPGRCVLIDGEIPHACSLGYGPGPQPVPDDLEGYGPGDEQGPGPQQPSETPKVGEPKQTPEPPDDDDDSGKNQSKEGSGSSQKSKP